MSKLSAAVARSILLQAARATAERYEAEARAAREQAIAYYACTKHWLTRRPLGEEKATRIVDDRWAYNITAGDRERYWAARARELEAIALTSHLSDIRLLEPDIRLLREALNDIEEDYRA